MTGSKRIGRRCEFGHWPYADVWRAEGTIVQLSSAAPLDSRCENRNLRPPKLWIWEPIAGGPASRCGRAWCCLGPHLADFSGNPRWRRFGSCGNRRRKKPNVPPVPSIISKCPLPYDLLAWCNAIERPLADDDPVMALERMFELIDLAPSPNRAPR